MKIQCIQHVAFEGPGMIAQWALGEGHAFTTARMDRGEPIPSPDMFDWLVVMGGPMSVHDEKEYPWLIEEKRVIDSAIAAHKRVLGICLGAQLIASVLGARVYPNPEREVGWFPVTSGVPTEDTVFKSALPLRFLPFHWHGETFDLPKGAVRLAQSDACQNQAFAYGNRVLGLQFHLEMTPAGIQSLVAHCPQDLKPGRFVQTDPQVLLDGKNIENAQAILRAILNVFNSRISSG